VTRKLLLLNGLAILGIVLHHASAYTLQAMFEWTDRYMPVSVPNYDQLGSPAYFLLMTIRLLAIWSVPAFLFISGYYAGFMTKGNDGPLKWNSMLPRVKVLLYPFIVWTAIRFILLRSFPTSLDQVLNPYHFVPLLIQFYLLAPWITRLAKRNWKLLLAGAALIHLVNLGIGYLTNIGFSFPGQDVYLALTPRWFFLTGQPFWFPFGIVFGIHFYNRGRQLARLKWPLLATVILLSLFILAEYSYLDYLNGEEWLGPVFNGLAAIPYSLAVILCFLAFNDVSLPLSSELTQVGAKSLGIYLGNIPCVYVVAVLMYHFTPWLLGYHLIYYSILAVAGLGGPLLLMELVRRSPVRVQYRILFG
jgi:surface polysaccharide O-acyltransferase-like enzyme